jgi:DNA repair protein RecO (recombination protein O)
MLTVLTPAHGKLDAIAYGARKPTSRKTGHVELFTLADMMLNLRREPGVVTQVELIEPFMPLREDITLSAYASYAVELLDRFTQTGDEDLHGLFDLLRDTLARLCAEPDPRLVLRYYEVHLLGQVGFRPELQTCVLSGNTVRPEHQYFSFADGGVVCPEVGTKNPNLPQISFHALKLLRHIQRSPYQQVGSLKISEKLHIEVEALMLGYATYLLERQLQSAEFIRRLRRMTG